MTAEPSAGGVVDDLTARAVLREDYGVTAVALSVLSGGLDHRAQTFRVDRQGAPSLALRAALDVPSPAATLVPLQLHRLGATAVVAPLASARGDVVVRRHDLAWTLSPFVDGEDGWTHGMQAGEWAALGAALRDLHRTTLPAQLHRLVPRDSFDVESYAAAFHRCDGALAQSSAPTAFTVQWNAHRPVLSAMLDQMGALSTLLRGDRRSEVVCHGDLHPGNVLVAGDGVHLIDWGEVLLAPRERDLIFVPDLAPRARGIGPAAAGPCGEAFLSAYDPGGALELDWPALTYYRCERVLQDVIEEGQQALRAVGDEERGPAYWLRHILQPGGEAEDALATAQLLPPDLNLLSAYAPTAP